MRIKRKVLRVDPEPVDDGREERVGGLLQIEDVLLVPVEGRHALEKLPNLTKCLAGSSLCLL